MIRISDWAVSAAAAITLASVSHQASGEGERRDNRPNILLFVTDDQSWLHAGAYGDAMVDTPAFDRVAREGTLFRHAYAASPRCTPSRSAILTGQDIWRLEEGGLFGETLPKKFPVFPLLLERAGYFVGWTGKGWGPGDLKAGGWKDTNPLGKEYNEVEFNMYKLQKELGGRVRRPFRINYAANFEQFLEDRPEGPFFFWAGTAQPHRPYIAGSGVRSGKELETVIVPEHLPDTEWIRSDFLDYALQIDYADSHLARMLEILEQASLLDNTLVVVTSDQGIALPRAKGTLYDLGVRVPLAIAWPARVLAGRTVDDFVCLTDLAPTFLAVGEAPIPESMTGRSLLSVLLSNKSGQVDESRNFVVTALESDHSLRGIRTHEVLYIRNLNPGHYDPGGLSYLDPYRDHPRYDHYYNLICQKPPEELYDVSKDVWQVNNVVSDPAYKGTLEEAREALDSYLRKTGGQ